MIPFLVCTSALLITTNAKAVEAPLDLISLEDLTPEDRKQLEILNHQASRSKRSGSGDILSHLKTAIAHGIARKVSQFAKAPLPLRPNLAAEVAVAAAAVMTAMTTTMYLRYVCTYM